MLYKEFEEQLARLGFRVECGEYQQIIIYTLSDDVAVARIFDNYQYDLYLFDKLSWLENPIIREKFINLALEYASTPVEWRREKKYNVVAYRRKYGNPNGITEKTYFYWRDEDDFLRTRSSKDNDDPYQQWTLKQIGQYGLGDCEKIEVED